MELNESIQNIDTIAAVRDQLEINSSEEDQELEKYMDEFFNPTQNVSDYINVLGKQIVRQRSQTRGFSVQQDLLISPKLEVIDEEEFDARSSLLDS